MPLPRRWLFFFLFSSFTFSVNLWGSPFWVKYCVCDRFVLIQPLSSTHSVCEAECVFVAGIHPSRACMSGSFESLRLNACVHRLDIDLYSQSKEFGEMESEPILTPRKKNPFHRRIRGGIEPATLHHAGQLAQHTTD